MSLLSLRNIYYSVGEFPLLDHVDFEIQPKERIALIGRNGQGKSTLFKILSGQIAAEQGELIKAPDFKISCLAQALPEPEEITVYEAVARGVQDLSDLLVTYHTLISQEDNHDDAWLKSLTEIQHKIETMGGWQIQQRIDRVVHELSLPADKKMSELSGGWRRRVSLAQALVQEPDILLLDEPTNHLDLAAIQWLEKMLLNYPKTIIFITHDRALLRKLATHIVELDRGKLTSYPADYDVYLARKEQTLADEEKHNALFDKRLSEEEQWLRQGVKARRTRNEGRVRALKALREERGERRVREKNPNFALNDINQAGKTIVQAKDVSFEYVPGKRLIDNFTFTIQRGDKIAIVGENGSGKTTLVKLLLGELTPTSGTIKHSPTNQIAFFDQNREQLDKNLSLIDNVAEGDDFIEIQGKKKHVIGYLGDFLFSPDKCRGLANRLSGGEQNRLMLAKLFSKPANLLVMDEPTNDLDIESLNVLENLLLTYPGTVIIISHDREFVDNIATHCIAFEDNGKISINVGGYSDWLERKAAIDKESKENKDKKNKNSNLSANTKSSTPAKKLTFNEQQELKNLPIFIEKAEKEIKELEILICQPDFYTRSTEDVQKVHAKIEKLKQDASEAYARWEILDSR